MTSCLRCLFPCSRTHNVGASDEESEGSLSNRRVSCCGSIFNTTTLFLVIGVVGIIFGGIGALGLCAAFGVSGLSGVSSLLVTVGEAVGATPLTLSAFVTSIGGASLITAFLGVSSCAKARCSQPGAILPRIN
ncbi:MAG: hypothetical protein KDK55_00850 [Chlamydiia bacterium]|nr:hypothetical protein [Chlamydiia bacterium]